MTRVVFPREVPVAVPTLSGPQEAGVVRLWDQHRVPTPEGGLVIVLAVLNDTGWTLRRLKCQVRLVDAIGAALGAPAWAEVKPYRLGPGMTGELRVALPAEARGLVQVAVGLRGEAEGEPGGVAGEGGAEGGRGQGSVAWAVDVGWDGPAGG